MDEPFVPEDFTAPLDFVGSGFRLEPLGSHHNERDYDAWMSSLDHIRATPGFPDSSWPSPMSLEENLADLVRHAQDFAERRGFTYSVLDGDDVIGCVYIYPSKESDRDAAVQSWVRTSRAAMDEVLFQAVKSWLHDDWPFENVDYTGRDGM
ncbi:MAG: N-acetyltransferase [Acidimicrobiales bacterium]